MKTHYKKTTQNSKTRIVLTMPLAKASDHWFTNDADRLANVNLDGLQILLSRV